MELDRDLVGKIALMGQFVFVVYFAVFLLLDMMVDVGATEYDFLDPALYYSATSNAILSILLFMAIFFLLRKGEMLKVIALGIVFIASPLRALFMINLGSLGGLPLNNIYDLAVIAISAFLLYKFARPLDRASVGLGLVSLFYIYIFLVSVAVPFRDFLVASNLFLPISFGSYLHWGFYDYLTAGYAIFLGIYGLKLLAPELKKSSEKERKIERLNSMIRAGNYQQAAEFGDKILEEGGISDVSNVKVLTAYAHLKNNDAEKAYKVIEAEDGFEGLKGDICVALGKMDEAKMHYKLAVDADPKDYVSMVNLGKIYADEDNVREAEVWWTRALNVNKKDPVVWQNLSALEIVRGRHDAALDMLKEAEKYVKA